MDPIETVKKIKEKSSSLHPVMHFKTITKHRNLVCKYCLRLGLVKQGLTHDLSKYTPVEFWRGVKYYQGNRSPNDAERRQTGVSKAWLHHKGRNKHHFEYWIDYPTDPTKGKGLTGSKMPRRYVAEMVFDRVAACRVYKGEEYNDSQPLQYFLRSRDFSWYIHPVTKKELEFLLRMWAERGEKYTTAYIRDHFLKRKSGSIS